MISNIVIVGGVAGGASCAARARRIDENARITIFERGPFASFANCGLPYYVGQVITKESHLLVATPEMFKDRFNIDVQLNSEVVTVDRERKRVVVKDRQAGQTHEVTYDYLVLATGSRPIKPPLPGIDLPGIFNLWTIPDSRRIMAWLTENRCQRAVVVGGGFIGLEMAENFKKRGLDVTIVEMQPHVMPTLDPEMAAYLHDHLHAQKIRLKTELAVTGFGKGQSSPVSVTLSNGETLDTDVVVLAIGVRPRSDLARTTGLQIGTSGGIAVDPLMRTSDPNIWAVGDVVEVQHWVSGQPSLIPLAGPANRQGRIAADNILRPETSRAYRGTQGTAVCGILGLTVASTGASEKYLRSLPETHQIPYEKVYLHPNDHAGYYPNAQPIALKLIFAMNDGRVLGAQALGLAGVAKRVDVIAMSMAHQGTVFDLEEAELCYAPQYGSAKDPVNLAGMVAANVMRGDLPLAHWDQVPEGDHLLIDVRTPKEFGRGHVPRAINLPVDELRRRMAELPTDRPIYSYCEVGLRSYVASRLLIQHGFDVYTLSGGYLSYQAQRE